MGMQIFGMSSGNYLGGSRRAISGNYPEAVREAIRGAFWGIVWGREKVPDITLAVEIHCEWFALDRSSSECHF